MAGAAAYAPRTAHAAGTFFLLEVSTGIAEPAYEDGDIGWSYGLAAGGTWKFKNFPLRFHLLMNLMARNGDVRGDIEGIRFAAERFDIDLYVAHRIAMPIVGPVRLYLEFGLGQRWLSESLQRGAGLGGVNAASTELLLVVAGGMQVRLTDMFSVGLRAELTPLSPDADMIGGAANILPTSNRITGLATVGVHF